MRNQICMLNEIRYGEWEVRGECKNCHKEVVIKFTGTAEQAEEGVIMCTPCIREQIKSEVKNIFDEIAMLSDDSKVTQRPH